MMIINDDETDTKFKVTTCEDILIPPKESRFVEVAVVGNIKDRDVCTTPRIYDMDNKFFAVPATLLTGEKGYLKIYNVGDGKLKWNQGDLITRAILCDAVHKASDNTDELLASNSKDGRC
ncbi:uncharacterized protein LOC126381356 [Pectinophora gossypiella]|uniref:uncharacterized protein LOC126381356 n=1 Tax=Pectinophora gossypiella TaxID=13191 RepID=UPI00214E1725|nr:uncharacterized protein LOC126381356 [Pectinophora gossypiella]